MVRMTMRMISTIGVMFLLAAMRVLACPSCSDNFTKGGANAGVGESYSWSVLFLLGVPLTIVAVFAFMVVRRMRAAR